MENLKVNFQPASYWNIFFPFPFSLLNSKKRLRSCCKWKSKSTSRRQTRQCGDSPTYEPPKSSKPQSLTNYESKTFLSFYTLKTSETAASGRAIRFNKCGFNKALTKLVAEIKSFLVTRNLSTQTKEAEAFCWEISNKSKQLLKEQLLKLATFMSKSAIACFLQKLAKHFYFSTTTYESQNSLFVARK